MMSTSPAATMQAAKNAPPAMMMIYSQNRPLFKKLHFSVRGDSLIQVLRISVSGSMAASA